jgi:hypothetical protein
MAFPVIVSAADDNANSCVSCHQILPSVRQSSPVVESRGGLHESSGVSCSGCHGGDPSEIDKVKSKSAGTGYQGVPSPAVEGARLLCGKCHKAAYETWVSSGHNPGAPCASCHGAHRIGKATLDLIGPARCSGCHPFPRANPLKTHILEARTAVLSVRAMADKLALEGMEIKKVREGLAALDARVTVMHHMADSAAIKAASGKIRSDAGRLGAELKNEEEKWRFGRKVLWGAVVISALFFLTAAYIAIHRIKTRKMLGR